MAQTTVIQYVLSRLKDLGVADTFMFTGTGSLFGMEGRTWEGWLEQMKESPRKR